MVKRRYSAFHKTDLLEILKQLGVKKLIIAGYQLGACVNATAIDAYQFDFPHYIVSDAVVATSQSERDRYITLYEEIEISKTTSEIIELINHSSSYDVIYGESIYFRRPLKDELIFIKKMWGDEDTMKEVGGPISMNQDKHLEWFKMRVDPGFDGGFYCLIFNKDHNAIGEISYRLLDQGRMIGAQNIKILASERKKGYARDALLTFLDHSFNTRGINLMTDEIAIDNKVAQDFFISLGFTHYPDKSKHYWVEMDKATFNSKHTKTSC